MDAKEFERLVGHAPENDDLDRVNCPKAGSIGHWHCGWCLVHNKPHFMCGCLNKSQQINIDKGDLTNVINAIKHLFETMDAHVITVENCDGPSGECDCLDRCRKKIEKALADLGDTNDKAGTRS